MYTGLSVVSVYLLPLPYFSVNKDYHGDAGCRYRLCSNLIHVVRFCLICIRCKAHRQTNAQTRIKQIALPISLNWPVVIIACRTLSQLHTPTFRVASVTVGWLGSRVVSALDSGTEGSGFKSQSRRCRVTVLGKLFTPIVPLFTKQQNW